MVAPGLSSRSIDVKKRWEIKKLPDKLGALTIYLKEINGMRVIRSDWDDPAKSYSIP